MTWRAAACGLVLLATLALGVGGAVGREAATTTTVRVEVVGRGLVIDDKSSMRCGNGQTICRVSYSGTGSVEFTATPPDTGGWTFSGWDGDCSGTAATCDVSFDLSDDDHEVIATFGTPASPGDKTLTVKANGDAAGDGGNISGEDIDCDTGDEDCSTEVPKGSTLTIVETPDEGFVFGGWSGACSGSSRSCTLVMDDSKNATGTFRKPRLTVTVNGNGTVTGGGIACTNGSSSGCSAEVSAGTEVTLTATPPSGGSFTSWSGCTTSSAATCTVTMTGDKNVTANFSGGSVGPTTFPLSVSVTGSGTVTGGGINCGVGGTACSATHAAGTNVTLTATPGTGQAFTGWGGACSGSSRTCSLTMSAARSVTATFSGGPTAEVELSVAVTGRGTVTGGGISCGNGKTACRAKVRQDSTVGLTASPAAGARFGGWGGACRGKLPTCTVQMDEAKRVTAAFTGGSGRLPATGAAALSRIGGPLVSRTAVGYEVTLRFRTGARGTARVRALRAGRPETALAFTAAAGPARVGPFPVAKPGFYTFELSLGGRTLRWTACLGRCGERASSSPFILARGPATVDDAGALWSLTLHFRSTQPAGADVRVYRGKRLAREVRFPIRAGAAAPGALLLSSGTYRIRLAATDGVGRIRTLTWYALLP
ncbi:MAG: InlB B-repeat-containing protein [Verrucomicrobiota bacterium]